LTTNYSIDTRNIYLELSVFSAFEHNIIIAISTPIKDLSIIYAKPTLYYISTVYEPIKLIKLDLEYSKFEKFEKLFILVQQKPIDKIINILSK
jgi:hypothetical protein